MSTNHWSCVDFIENNGECKFAIHLTTFMECYVKNLEWFCNQLYNNFCESNEMVQCQTNLPGIFFAPVFVFVFYR